MAMKTQDSELEEDPFLCRCSYCSRFWSRHSSAKDRHLWKRPPQERSSDTSLMYKATLSKEKHPAILRIGDRVLVKNRFPGVVKYLGVLDESQLSPCTQIGVKLDDQVGSTHNGTIRGKRYFHCPPGHGAMVKYNEVTLIKPPAKRPPVFGNPMFPSFRQIYQARKQRAQQDPCMNFGPPFNSRDSDGNRVRSNKSSTRATSRPFSAPVMIFNQTESDTNSVCSSIRRDSLTASSFQPEKQRSFQRWKNNFGGDEQAEILAKTLQKLHLAYERGRSYKEEASSEGCSSDKDTTDEDITEVQPVQHDRK